jgi:plastocyanin
MSRKTFGMITGFVTLSVFATLALASTVPFMKIQMESWAPYYFPTAPSVALGTVVRWENPTATHHTVTQDGCEKGKPCLFDSGSVPPYGVYELPELPPGEYSYHCALHPIMRGTIVVTASSNPSKI